MKTFRIMCAALLAAMTLASCQKEQEQTPENKNYKSVDIVLSNIMPNTKLAGGGQALDGKKIVMNSIQFFFTDGTSVYAPKTEDGITIADTYWTAEEIAAMTDDQTGVISGGFHFLPSSVTKVVAVGNQRELSISNVAELNSVIELASQQNISNFALYAEGPLVGTPANGGHETNGGNDHTTLVYNVELNIVPLVARFEVKKIGCNFSSDGDKTITVKGIAFADFYNKCTLATRETSDMKSLTTDMSSVFNYFTSGMRADKWNNDFFGDWMPKGSLDNCHDEIILKNETDKNIVDVDIAYNFYPTTDAPLHLLNLLDGNDPAYIFTKKYKDVYGNEITQFEPGKIYRMDMIFNHEDLDHQDICVDITVKVASWELVVVTPEF